MDYQYEYIKLKSLHTRVKAMHDQRVANLKREIKELTELINNPVQVPKFDTDMEKILEVVVSVTNIFAAEILSKTRKREVVTARALFCYLACKHSNKGPTLIGRFIGRDHSTVIHNIDNYQDYLDTNQRDEVNYYEACLRMLR